MSRHKKCNYRVVTDGRKKNVECHEKLTTAIRAAKHRVLHTLKGVAVWGKRKGLPARFRKCFLLPRGMVIKGSRVHCDTGRGRLTLNGRKVKKR